jgi:putative tricarboxylic transport membrane protein
MLFRIKKTFCTHYWKNLKKISMMWITCKTTGVNFKKFEYEGAPLILAFVLGSMFEVNLRRSLLMSQGSFSIFFTRPIAVAALLVCAVLIGLSLHQFFKKTARKKAAA